MDEKHLYRSVLLKKSALTPAMLANILKATTEDIDIADPDIYIMVRIKENLSDKDFDNSAIPVKTFSAVVPEIQYDTSSGKGNPPGTKSL